MWLVFRPGAPRWKASLYHLVFEYLCFCAILDHIYHIRMASNSEVYMKSIPIRVTIEPVAGVSIYPDHTSEANPGETLDYAHTVMNKGNIADTFNITYASTLGWDYKFFTDPNGDGNPADGVELIDTNGDGIIDTGKIDISCDKQVVTQVIIPEDSAVGEDDNVVITATSIMDSAFKQRTKGQDGAKNITTVIPPTAIFGKQEPIPAPIESGVLPFTGAVLLPLFIMAGILIGSGTSWYRRRKLNKIHSFVR